MIRNIGMIWQIYEENSWIKIGLYIRLNLPEKQEHGSGKSMDKVVIKSVNTIHVFFHENMFPK